ncbi:MAG TPA: hypothetical protein VGF32_14495 [Streptosporangiaceae bacterium]|jgi:hypothetical protein
MTTTQPAPVRIPAHNSVTKHVGNWTTARTFDVRAHRGHAVVDLRSPRIEDGDIELELDLDHAVLKLLVPDDAVVDDWNLRRTGRGKVSDPEAPKAAAGRRIVVTGHMRDAEIRVRRGGIAVLSAMFSREYVADLRRAHATGTHPTVADPAHTA